MITDLDIRRQNHRLREELAIKDEVIDSLLEAPYMGMTAWAVSFACAHRGHPTKPKGDTCYCGHVSPLDRGGA